MATKQSIISQAFIECQSTLLNYICRRINNIEDAQDILQDVFERLSLYELINETTVRSLCFTIANHIVVDHLRRHYKRQEVYAHIFDAMAKQEVSRPDQIAACNDLEATEESIAMQLAPATRRVYEMTRKEGLSIEEIASTLHISPRTVACHQYKARLYVREQMQMVI